MSLPRSSIYLSKAPQLGALDPSRKRRLDFATRHMEYGNLTKERSSVQFNLEEVMDYGSVKMVTSRVRRFN
jgi:hypothetical protein